MVNRFSENCGLQVGLIVENFELDKLCRFDGDRCYFASCDSLDALGNVVLCNRHRHRNGFFVRKLSKLDRCSVVFNKHKERFS